MLAHTTTLEHLRLKFRRTSGSRLPAEIRRAGFILGQQKGHSVGAALTCVFLSGGGRI